jgi:hypothetical protein
MKIIVKVVLFVLFVSNVACSQAKEEKLAGSWSLVCDFCEFEDMIILRADNKYFIYNPQNADIGSLEMYGKLRVNDLIIDSSYTSLVEKGVWRYNSSTQELTLTERNILGEWTSFSETYGKSSELKLKLGFVSESIIELCNAEKRDFLCEKYQKGDRYKELSEEFTGTGSQEKEILLSGYETRLKLSYELYKEADQLTIMDGEGKELFVIEMNTTNGIRSREIPLKGVTRLVLKIKSSETGSAWRVAIEII